MEIAEYTIQSLLSTPHLTVCEVIHTTVKAKEVLKGLSNLLGGEHCLRFVRDL